MTEEKPKRVRKPRRNFEKLVTDLKTYCEISIAVIESMPIPGGSDFNSGQLAAIKAVLSRLQ